jgi:hypothetical protein
MVTHVTCVDSLIAKSPGVAKIILETIRSKNESRKTEKVCHSLSSLCRYAYNARPNHGGCCCGAAITRTRREESKNGAHAARTSNPSVQKMAHEHNTPLWISIHSLVILRRFLTLEHVAYTNRRCKITRMAECTLFDA